jgi:ADP-ribose pyrophosphatase
MAAPRSACVVLRSFRLHRRSRVDARDELGEQQEKRMTIISSGKHVLLLSDDNWEYAERKKGKEAVAVIAVTEDGRLILTEQERRPVDARVIDLPAGLVGDEDEHHDAAATAKKELEEETGYVCDSVELLAKGPSSPGITSELVSFYRASGVRQTGEGGGVGGESITVHAIPIARIERWLKEKQEEGVLVDLKVWGALYFSTKST